MERIDKINYYLDIAETSSNGGKTTTVKNNISETSTNSNKITNVKEDIIETLSNGYVGAPRGRKNCTDLGYCIRYKLHP